MDVQTGPKATRLRVGAALAAAGLIITAGCGGGSKSDAEAEQAAQQGGTLKFYSDKAGWEPQLKKMSEASKSATNIDLELAGYSDADAYSAFIKQSFRTKESPGLFSWHTGAELADLTGDDLIAESTERWNKGIADGNLPEGLKDSYTYDGKQYCTPMNVAYWVTFYNKKIFDEQGLQPPTTWTEMEDAATKLKGAGVTPFYQTDVLFSFAWFQTLVANTDPELYEGLTSGKVKFTDPRIVEVMDRWRTMMDKGWFNPAGSTTEPAVMLQKGEVAMLPFGSFATANLNQLDMKLGEDYGYFLTPKINDDGGPTPVAVESAPLCTSEKSPQKALANRYADWSITPEAQTTWSRESGQVSFNTRAEAPNPELQKMNEQVNSDEVVLYDRYFEAVPTDVVTVSLEQFGAFIANPGDPMPFLETIQDVADKAEWQ